MGDTRGIILIFIYDYFVTCIISVVRFVKAVLFDIIAPFSINGTSPLLVSCLCSTDCPVYTNQTMACTQIELSFEIDCTVEGESSYSFASWAPVLQTCIGYHAVDCTGWLDKHLP